jgi:hypothetical protein
MKTVKESTSALIKTTEVKEYFFQPIGTNKN